MLIKTTRKHENGYGEKYVKNVGDVYDHPEPAALIQLKFAEEAPNGSDGNKDGGLPGDGESTLPVEKVDSEEHDGEVDDKEPRTDKRSREGSRSKRSKGSRGRNTDIPESDEQEQT